jgi:arylsulfatase A-like enzyme
MSMHSGLPWAARMESRSSRSSLPWSWLSSALAAAFLNLGTAALDHPRALISWTALGLPLATGFVALLLGAAAVQGGLGWLGRRLGLASGPLAAALAAAFVLAAALAPLVEVGLRDTSSERAGVVWSCALGFVGSAAVASYLLAVRAAGRAPLAALVQVFVPLAALAALGVAWSIEYRAAGAAGRALVFLAGALALAASARVAARGEPGRILPALGVLVLAWGALGALQGEREPAAPRVASRDLPPVVLITVDTLRADRVLGDGERRVPTPAIDRLAADSVVFTNARSPAPWTKPALASLLTGLSPLVHGMTTRRARLPDRVETLAERLQAAGYRTAGIGLNAHLERVFRLDQGFDDYRFPARADHGLALGARVLEHLAPQRFPELFPSTEAIADVAVDWLHAHAREPFFLWLHVLDPHWPYEPPREWVEHAAVEPRRWGDPAQVTEVQAGSTKPGRAERERVTELYAGEIRYVDACLGRVLSTLEELGLYSRALVVFASDHGEEFWEHGRYEHGHTLYDEVLRVPLAFKLPSATTRERVAADVSTEALVPTVLDVLGLPYDPELLTSRSLASFLRDPAAAPPGPIFSAGTYYFGEKRGVVFEGKKLVLELDTGKSELFDLSADPRELRSLSAAEREAHARGLGLIREWQERCAELRARLGIEEGAAAEVGEDVQRMLQELGYAGSE